MTDPISREAQSARMLLTDRIAEAEEEMAADIEDAQHTGEQINTMGYEVVMPYETAQTILRALPAQAPAVIGDQKPFGWWLKDKLSDSDGFLYRNPERLKIAQPPEEWIVTPLYAQPPAPAVKVKPLVWCQYGDGGVYTRAASTGRQYAVFPSAERPGEYAAHPLGSRAYSYFPTLEDAKAAMQADHAARILAAIEPAQGGEA